MAVRFAWLRKVGICVASVTRSTSLAPMPRAVWMVASSLPGSCVCRMGDSLTPALPISTSPGRRSCWRLMSMSPIAPRPMVPWAKAAMGRSVPPSAIPGRRAALAHAAAAVPAPSARFPPVRSCAAHREC